MVSVVAVRGLAELEMWMVQVCLGLAMLGLLNATSLSSHSQTLVLAQPVDRTSAWAHMLAHWPAPQPGGLGYRYQVGAAWIHLEMAKLEYVMIL